MMPYETMIQESYEQTLVSLIINLYSISEHTICMYSNCGTVHPVLIYPWDGESWAKLCNVTLIGEH